MIFNLYNFGLDFPKWKTSCMINQKQKRKVKDFKKYLVESGTMMHFVKFLLGVRNKQIADDYVPSTDPISMFVQYFGKIQPDTTEQDKIRQKINNEKQQNQKLKAELQEVKQAIKTKKQEIAKKQQQQRLREQEEAKNPKKGKK